MMHEREKSDPAIVAVKPTNKAERSAAEPVEPRAGTKGNADQHSTCRAQNRATVSQALERIRQVRRHSPEVGAVCGKAARTDLCGGRSAMGVPTAIVARAPRNDSEAHLRVLAARSARGLQVSLALSKTEGAGNAGCALHPRSRAQWSSSCAHEHTGQRRQSDIPCAMALRLIRYLPGDRLF